METISQGFSRAVNLIFSGDRELFEIILLSLRVSGAALLLAAKSAAMKALGVGFRYAGPRELEVSSPVVWPGGLLLSVKAGSLVPVWVRRLDGGFLALALKAGFENLAV